MCTSGGSGGGREVCEVCAFQVLLVSSVFSPALFWAKLHGVGQMDRQTDTTDFVPPPGERRGNRGAN